MEVRCVEGYGANLYVGRSDGVVEWWVCDGAVAGDQVGVVHLLELGGAWLIGE